MEDSILVSVKEYLGISEDDPSFDQEILMNINAVFSTLYQIGVDELKDTMITDGSQTWSDVFAQDAHIINMVRSYVQLRVRVIFDPPTSSFVMEAMKQQISEFEWRINLAAEGGFEANNFE